MYAGIERAMSSLTLQKSVGDMERDNEQLKMYIKEQQRLLAQQERETAELKKEKQHLKLEIDFERAKVAVSHSAFN